MGSRSLARSRYLAALLLILHLGGCYSWRPTTVSPPELVAERPYQLRVTRPDLTRVTLRTPEIRGDSIVGRGDQGVALAEVQSIEVYRVSGGRTALLIIGTPVLILVGAYIFVCLELCGSS